MSRGKRHEVDWAGAAPRSLHSLSVLLREEQVRAGVRAKVGDSEVVVLVGVVSGGVSKEGVVVMNRRVSRAKKKDGVNSLCDRTLCNSLHPAHCTTTTCLVYTAFAGPNTHLFSLPSPTITTDKQTHG
jgi:hypothetical protein